jgi:hypothetical protein
MFLDKIKTNNVYIKEIEKKYDINYKFDFVLEDFDQDSNKDIYSVVYIGTGKDGFIKNIMEALMYVCIDKKIEIHGIAPFSECIGDVTQGIVSISPNQISIITYYETIVDEDQPQDKTEIHKLVGKMEIIKRTTKNIF